MKHGLRWSVLVTILTLASAAALSPAARASVTPSVSTSTATPLTAGASGNLDLALSFAPSSSGGRVDDTPKAVTIDLPPGVFADAAAAGGTCLTSVQINDPSPCQIGSGQITGDLLGYIPIQTGVNFYLVPPPNPGDLAGLAVAALGTQVGQTGDITLRPSGDPAGVGLRIALTLPNAQANVALQISKVDATFTGLRFPTTCPSTPAPVGLAASSYADSTVRTASLPLPIAGCGALPYHPKFSFGATRDKTDNQVSISTDITQSADESPNSTVALTLPQAQLKPALGGLAGLCDDPAGGTCTPVASVTAVSPDYPAPLTGQGYLTGKLGALKLTLIFPSPFPITLTGTVDLTRGTTTFSGIPDLPLTELKVDLNGGKAGLFDPNCTNRTGTATAGLTNQNGDRTVKVPSRFTTQGCPAATGSTGGGHRRSHKRTRGKPHVSGARLTGLRSGRPALSLSAVAGPKAKLRRVTVALPSGLSFAGVRGVSVRGARSRAATISKGRLVVTLRSAARRVTVSATRLRESPALRRQARRTSTGKRPKRLALAVTVTDATGTRTTIHVRV